MIKKLQKFSLRLKMLYVEDNDSLREETAKVFAPLFQHVDLASNGKEGLEKYNQAIYDIVITDINMPIMNGMEMIERIREINPEQKIIAISAHDETTILLNLIRKGVSSFIIKPINLDDMLMVLYPVCRDADVQNTNLELFDALQAQGKKLKQMVGVLTSYLHTVDIKNDQLGELSTQVYVEDKSQLLEEYFAKDEEQGDEKVVFIWDDCEEMRDILNEIPDELSFYTQDSQIQHIHQMRDAISKISNILFRYSPFLDPLAEHLERLSRIIGEEKDFIDLLKRKPDHVLKLVDAICIDLSIYVKRFATESMAMKNIHHIHQPTTLSIQQIISMILPVETEDEGDFELF